MGCPAGSLSNPRGWASPGRQQRPRAGDQGLGQSKGAGTPHVFSRDCLIPHSPFILVEVQTMCIYCLLKKLRFKNKQKHKKNFPIHLSNPHTKEVVLFLPNFPSTWIFKLWIFNIHTPWCTPTRMAARKGPSMPSVGEDVEQREVPHSASGDGNGTVTLENSSAVT